MVFTSASTQKKRSTTTTATTTTTTATDTANKPKPSVDAGTTMRQMVLERLEADKVKAAAAKQTTSGAATAVEVTPVVQSAQEPAKLATTEPSQPVQPAAAVEATAKPTEPVVKTATTSTTKALEPESNAATEQPSKMALAPLENKVDTIKVEAATGRHVYTKEDLLKYVFCSFLQVPLWMFVPQPSEIYSC